MARRPRTRAAEGLSVGGAEPWPQVLCNDAGARGVLRSAGSAPHKLRVWRQQLLQKMLRDAVLRNAALQNSRPRVVHTQEPPRAYLDTHHVPFYLNDVTTLLLRIRPTTPLDFIASYFSEVLNGTHVLLREFAYVSACPHNRWSFVRVVQESFAGVSPAHHELSAVDLLQQRGQGAPPWAVPDLNS